MRTLVIGSHLIGLITPEILQRLKDETGEDVELKVAEPIHLPPPTLDYAIKAATPYEREPRPKVDRSEQRRHNRAVSAMLKRGVRK